MAPMGGMPIPGGWTMSSMWIPMCGQTWIGLASGFLGMWLAMMVAMMTPSLVPMLAHYRAGAACGNAVRAARLAALTAIAAVAYFSVWALVGLLAFASGSAFAGLAMRMPAIASVEPLATGIVVLLAGTLQFTSWKARQLACCRGSIASGRPPGASGFDAFGHGLHLGARCVACCAGLTAILLAMGVMDLGAMAIVTAAISAERLAPAGERVAKSVGVLIVVGGVGLIVRAIGGA